MPHQLAVLGAIAAMTAAFTATPAAHRPAPSPLVINEVRPTTKGFVEIRNVSGTVQYLDNARLDIYDRTNRVIATIVIPHGEQLAPGEMMVLVGPGHSGPVPCQALTMADGVPSQGGAKFVRGIAVDGFGTVAGLTATEGRPASPPPLEPGDQSSGRDTKSTDTDNNSSDFTVQRESPCEPNPGGCGAGGCGGEAGQGDPALLGQRHRDPARPPVRMRPVARSDAHQDGVG